MESTLADAGQSLINKVKMPVRLSDSVIITKNTEMSVYLERIATARLLTDDKRMLADIIMLSVKDAWLDPSGQMVQIKSSSPGTTDLTSYILRVDFAAGVLISVDGFPIDATTNTFPLSEPTFVSSYFSQVEYNAGLLAPGIIFILIGIIMVGLSDWNDRVLQSWMWF